jgi:predicted Zn finger-like uncharacterized protein
MKIVGVTCPKCRAGFRRIELSSLPGTRGEYHCPVCQQNLETFDGSTVVAYRLTIRPVKGNALSDVATIETMIGT